MFDGSAPVEMRTLLERGSPHEVMPERLSRVMEQARRYVAETSHPPDARLRVEQVWLRSTYQPAWLPYTPVTGHEVPD